MSRTAFTTAQIALLYTQPQAVIGYGLAVSTPATVWAGTVTSVPTFPADGTGIGQVSVTTTSGAYTDVMEGMTVVFGDMSVPRTSFPYYTYARKVPTSTVLYIDGQGNGATEIIVGTKFTVLYDWLPQPRRFRYNSGNWYCNFDTAYTDQNEVFEPQAVMGCSAVIYKNGSQTFSFDGTRSKAWTAGATITGYLWTFPDGSTSTSSAPTWATSTAYPNGAYVHLTVTDSNGKTGTGHRLIFKFDSTHQPNTAFQITEKRGEWGGGHSITIKSLDPLYGLGGSYSAPYNHCVLFWRTAYGTTVQEIGGNVPNRENIILDGWLVGSEMEQSMNGNLWTYTIATAEELLRRQQGFAVEIDNDASSPTTWLTMKPMTLDNVFWHYCRWRSTISLCLDAFAPNTTASTRTKHLHDIAAGDMLQQIKDNYGWLIGGQAGCDHQSALYCEQDFLINSSVSCPFMLTLIDESNNPRKSLIRENFQLPSQPYYVRNVAKQTTYGVDYAGGIDIPVGSRAPDDPLAHGASLEEIPAGLWGTQTELNLWTGRLRAKKDNPFPTAHYPLIGLIDIDPTPQCRVRAFNNDYNTGVVRSYSMEFDAEHGMAYSTLDCENTAIAEPNGTTIDFTVI